MFLCWCDVAHHASWVPLFTVIMFCNVSHHWTDGYWAFTRRGHAGACKLRWKHLCQPLSAQPRFVSFCLKTSYAILFFCFKQHSKAVCGAGSLLTILSLFVFLFNSCSLEYNVPESSQLCVAIGVGRHGIGHRWWHALSKAGTHCSAAQFCHLLLLNPYSQLRSLPWTWGSNNRLPVLL